MDRLTEVQDFIETWASNDPSVKLIVLTRNFGHQNAVSAGLSFASGNYVGIMDADLQDQPEILLDMYRTLKRKGRYSLRGANRSARNKLKAFLLFRVLPALSFTSLIAPVSRQR